MTTGSYKGSTLLDDQVLAELDVAIRHREFRSARKRIEQERKRLLEFGDVDGLRRLEFPAGCLAEHGEDLARAIRQDIRRLAGPPYNSEPPPEEQHDWGSLVLSLFLSFLYCAFLAVGGAGVDTVGAAVVWIAACAVYWLVFAVLQVRWWRRGYEDFWRPVYAWSLLAFICLTLLFLPLLLVPRFRRWLFPRLKPTGKGDIIEVFEVLARWIGRGPPL